MALRHRKFLTISLSLALAGAASFAMAEDAKPAAGAAKATSPKLTGKERLGRKWTDEQRIDNCKVPLDKRGSKPRPSACPDAPPS
ncbi:MAG TPA: hypothetical protein VKR55_21570 [Bradyrhizobium sp.]|uniref:hypothetical protein n=1 Tax=Bradyrhizobium sp. TaxID=376 RepID=UPI002C9803D2|nr:hypothetical protein [Bradyrhizobium sp.]HLZ04724.1 hypothetical protein [Bradyrhizobium sp.]